MKCPLLKCDCLKKQCGFFMEASEICSIKSIAISLDNIHDKTDIIHDALVIISQTMPH